MDDLRRRADPASHVKSWYVKKMRVSSENSARFHPIEKEINTDMNLRRPASLVKASCTVRLGFEDEIDHLLVGPI
jgi:hypothetical protein